MNTFIVNRAYFLTNKKDPNRVLFYDSTAGDYKVQSGQWDKLQRQAVVFKRYTGTKVYIKLDSTYLESNTPLLQPLADTITPSTPNGYWHISNPDHEGYYKIHDDKSPSNYLTNTSPLVIAVPSTNRDDQLWKLNLIPKLSEIQANAASHGESESESESEGDSDSDWEDIARYIFREGLKMMRTAASSEWFDMDEETRREYVRLWKKMGRKKGVYD